MNIGAQYLGQNVTRFTVWSPYAEKLSVHIYGDRERVIELNPAGHDYWSAEAADCPPRTRYKFMITKEGKTEELTDPVSHFQPEGVFGPSEVVDHSAYPWRDEKWEGHKLRELIIYELHVGTFTTEGTFDAVIPRLPELVNLGITAIEIMPVAQFSGKHNWGYDGVYPYAVQNSYGGPEGLKRLVDACHSEGLSVILDVVYNHLGPEGNYLFAYAPYTTGKYHTPWGYGINFDDRYSDEVRNYFIGNALHWLEHYHVDGLRLDAIHGIFDMSAKHFLRQLEEEVKKYSYDSQRECILIAESSLNNPLIVSPQESGGFGLDAQWHDELHHALYTILIDERIGYYVDFGKMSDLAKAMSEGFVYSGQYSEFMKKSHGSSSKHIQARRFVVFLDNHDQTGNRPRGERFGMLVSPEAYKVAAGTILLSPYVPLLFMGEEYYFDSPFYYFTDHSDPGLIEAVRNGRKEEFAVYEWDVEFIDPQSESTFLSSKLDWEQKKTGIHRVIYDYYSYLIELRKTVPAFGRLERQYVLVDYSDDPKVLLLYRYYGHDRYVCLFHYGKDEAELSTGVFTRHSPDWFKGKWKRFFDSSGEDWGGPGDVLPETFNWGETLKFNPYSVAIYHAKR